LVTLWVSGSGGSDPVIIEFAVTLNACNAAIGAPEGIVAVNAFFRPAAKDWQ
jgi:hypothetical protein